MCAVRRGIDMAVRGGLAVPSAVALAKAEAFARPPVALNRVALQNEAIGDIGFALRDIIRAILHDRARGHGHGPIYLPHYHRSPQRAAVGDPRTSRGVPSFSLRSPQTELPFVIDIAYWHKADLVFAGMNVRC